MDDFLMPLQRKKKSIEVNEGAKKMHLKNLPFLGLGHENHLTKKVGYALTLKLI